MYETGNVDAFANAIGEVLNDLARYRQGLAENLELFREGFDPVDGLRQALMSAGIGLGACGPRGKTDAAA